MKLDTLTEESRTHIARLAAAKGITPEEVLAHFTKLFRGRKVCTHSKARGVFMTPASLFKA